MPLLDAPAMENNHTDANLTLYGYFRSSCTARLRIALLYTNINLEYIPVNLGGGSHLKEDYSNINPSKTVPTLFIPGMPAPITQSCATLEFLEETYPNAPGLLPRDAFSRAQVRSLIEIISSDVQPVTNMKILKEIRDRASDSTAWARKYHAKGFDAYETVVTQTAGKFSFGDDVTLADICLIPAVWNAERWGVDMSPYPFINHIYKNASMHPAFEKGHWKNQIDCPEELRK